MISPVPAAVTASAAPHRANQSANQTNLAATAAGFIDLISLLLGSANQSPEQSPLPESIPSDGEMTNAFTDASTSTSSAAGRPPSRKAIESDPTKIAEAIMRSM